MDDDDVDDADEYNTKKANLLTIIVVIKRVSNKINIY